MTNRKSKIKKGFTIVELLIVVAIIGLLASIILVLTKGSKEKAKIAALKQFSAQIYHINRNELLGEWNFNNGDFKDASGRGNDITNPLRYELTNTSSGVDGRGAVNNGTISSLIISPYKKDINGTIPSSITLEAWVKPPINQVKAEFYFFEEIPGYIFTYFNAGGSADGIFSFNVSTDASLTSCETSTSSGAFQLVQGEWNHVVGTYDSNKGEIKIYLNAKQITANVCAPKNIYYDLSDPTPTVWLAENREPSTTMIVDSIRAYGSPMSLSQIKKLYAVGPKLEKNN